MGADEKTTRARALKGSGNLPSESGKKNGLNSSWGEGVGEGGQCTKLEKKVLRKQDIRERSSRLGADSMKGEERRRNTQEICHQWWAAEEPVA